MKLINAVIAAVLAASPLEVRAQETSATPKPLASPSHQAPSHDVVTVTMKDGSTLRALIVDRTAGSLKLVTVGGVALEVPETSVKSIGPGSVLESVGRPSDSNSARLLFSPTGRPLRKGEGYFSDHFLVLPGVAYGVTENLSIGAGVSVIPGLGLDEQLFYASPRFGKQFSENVAVSAGVLLAHAGDGGETGSLGVGFAMTTLGKPDRSLTLGVGVARTVDQKTSGRSVNGVFQYETRTQASHTPVLMVGGTARLSPRLALVSENWLVLHENFNLSEQPFAVGIRFLGDRLSADVGVVLVREVIEQGFPVPWVSVTYHFGQRR